MCSLSARETRSASGVLWASDAMYAVLRSFHGGFGISSVSEFAATIAATAGPNSCSIRIRAVLPPPSFDQVVEHRADRLVLRAADLEHEGGHGEEVGRVGDGGALAELPAVVVEREGDGDEERPEQRVSV